MTIDFVNTLLRHLDEDRERIASELGLNLGQPILLTDLSLDAGDSHNGGEGVAQLTFDSNQQVVYKPKSLKVALWFRDLHSALAPHLSPKLRLRLHKIVAKGYHGWEQFVKKTVCQTRHDLEDFYRRVGVLLAIAQMIRAQDLHGENLIPYGAYPVPIDLEVVATPSPTLVDSGQPWLRYPVSLLITSPLSVGLLPALDIDLNGKRFYDGAFPSGHPMAARGGLCVPILDGRAALVEDYVEEIVEGYEVAARALRELSRGDSLHTLEKTLYDCPIRFVPRSTALYGSILKDTWTESPVSTLDCELQLERVVAETPAELSGLIRLADEEVWSLTHGDIPFFVTNPGSTTIWAPRGNPINVDFEPYHPLVLTQATGAGDRLNWDMGMIRASLGVLRIPA